MLTRPKNHIAMTTTANIKKSAFKKRNTKKARRQVDIKVFVTGFYQKYGEMMSKLSHE